MPDVQTPELVQNMPQFSRRHFRLDRNVPRFRADSFRPTGFSRASEAMYRMFTLHSTYLIFDAGLPAARTRVACQVLVQTNEEGNQSNVLTNMRWLGHAALH